jgi:hypothetical protein
MKSLFAVLPVATLLFSLTSCSEPPGIADVAESCNIESDGEMISLDLQGAGSESADRAVCAMKGLGVSDEALEDFKGARTSNGVQVLEDGAYVYTLKVQPFAGVVFTVEKSDQTGSQEAQAWWDGASFNERTEFCRGVRTAQDDGKFDELIEQSGATPGEGRAFAQLC